MTHNKIISYQPSTRRHNTEMKKAKMNMTVVKLILKLVMIMYMFVIMLVVESLDDHNVVDDNDEFNDLNIITLIL